MLPGNKLWNYEAPGIIMRGMARRMAQGYEIIYINCMRLFVMEQEEGKDQESLFDKGFKRDNSLWHTSLRMCRFIMKGP